MPTDSCAGARPGGLPRSSPEAHGGERALFRRDEAAFVDRDLHRLTAANGLAAPAISRHRDLLELDHLGEAFAGELLPDLLLRHLPDVAAFVRGGGLAERGRAERERTNERERPEFQDLHGFLPDESSPIRAASFRGLQLDAVSRVDAGDRAVGQHGLQGGVDMLLELLIRLHYPDRDVPVEVRMLLEGGDATNADVRMIATEPAHGGRGDRGGF